MNENERQMLQEQLDNEARNWGYRDYQEYLSEANTVENNTIVEKYYDKLTENDKLNPYDCEVGNSKGGELIEPKDSPAEEINEYYDKDSDTYYNDDLASKRRDELIDAEASAQEQRRMDAKQDEVDTKLQQFFAKKDKVKLNKCKELGMVQGFYYMSHTGSIWRLVAGAGPVPERPKNGSYVFKTIIGEPQAFSEEVVKTAINNYFGK